ncbi:diguanylate cyclase domain-containing protein [Sedimenticola sp.]|uniref:diguanylate cyclase domain-containing protein n=1 Tax=Sedimenticola sp. TaxID=1940285 RepID=UPI003D0E2406
MPMSEDRKNLVGKTIYELQKELECLHAHIAECGLCDIPDVDLSLAKILLEDKRSQGVIMDLALDAIVIIDETGAIVSFNRSAEAMFDYTRDEVMGREIASVIIPPSLRTPHYEGFSHYMSTGEARIMDRRVEVTAMRANGDEFPVELTVTEFCARGIRFFTAFIRDISERIEIERRLRQETALVQLLHRLTSLANEATSTVAAMNGFLREVCEYTDWPVGHVYTVNEENACLQLEPSECWYIRDEQRYLRFREITMRTVFASGEGIPGRVYSTGEPIWIEDVSKDPNFPRARVSGDLEIKTGFGLPVKIGQKVVAVLEFFTPDKSRNDSDFLATLNHIGIELGRVVEREQSAEQLRHLADYDTLTGLPNLRVGRDRLSQAVLSAKRNSSRFALLFVDLDGFKVINDSSGHEAGDAVLKIVAKRISQTLREMDTVARVGGDEFFIVLSAIESKTDVGLVAKKIIEVVSQPIHYENKAFSVGASIGVALFPEDAEKASELTRYADKAMYFVKSRGKNSFCFYDELTPDYAG